MLAQLGYSIYHDHATQQQILLDQQIETRKFQSQQRKIQAKASWDSAIRNIDSDLGSWIENHIKDRGSRSVHIEWAWVKTYENRDVEWRDERHLLVSGFISASPERGESQKFSWSVSMTLLDDGGWGRGKVSFVPASFPEGVFTVGIKSPRFP
jgi:hypothetical protein